MTDEKKPIPSNTPDVIAVVVSAILVIAAQTGLLPKLDATLQATILGGVMTVAAALRAAMGK